LWLASCTPLERPLTDPERLRLEGAFEALRVAGWHRFEVGGVDATRVAVDSSGEVVACFEPLRQEPAAHGAPASVVTSLDADGEQRRR
jgi:hypothetical protein